MTRTARRHTDAAPKAGLTRRGRVMVWSLAILALLAAAAAAVWLFAGDGFTKALTPDEPLAPQVTIGGITEGALLSAEDVEQAEVSLTTGDALPTTVSVTIDDEQVPVTTAMLGRDQLGRLEDGEHTLTVAAGRDRRWSRRVTESVTFVVDATPPTITLPETIETDGLAAPVEVAFTVGGADEVHADGGEVAWSGDGATASYDTPPATVAVTATDEAGNSTTAEVPVIVTFPGGRAVHTTPAAWGYEPKRTPIIEMIEAGLIDAVQLDVKDERGDIGFDSDIELADRSGADARNEDFDAAAAVEQIHDLGARVIGRMVVYRDSVLAQWAWDNGRRDMVTQTASGDPYTGGYGDFAFTNFANDDVQQYNIDIALEAAELGFDDILYDYIRRPDGNLDGMRFPGIGDRSPEQAVVEVMADAYPQLRERGVWVGASVFGIAIDRPGQIAQDIPMMAEHVDYISPMVYPNHWGPGEYGVASPEDSPYQIVNRSLSDYREVLAGTDTVIMPWLQDFGGYGEAEVRAQIDATADVTGDESFLLWDSGVTYTDGALDPIGGDEP